jgi:hypothetical protein
MKAEKMDAWKVRLNVSQRFYYLAVDPAIHVETLAMTARRSNHSARSHPHSARSQLTHIILMCIVYC